MNNARPPRRQLSFDVKFPMGEFIKTICLKQDDGMAHYVPPWSDDLAWRECQKRFGQHITINHFKSVRQGAVGLLAPAKGGIIGSKKTVQQITDIAVRLNALEDWAAKRKDNPFGRPTLQLDI